MVLTVAGVVLAGAAAAMLLPGVVERVPSGGAVFRLGPPRRATSTDAVLVLVLAAVWGAIAAAIGPEPELPAFLYLGWIGVALAAIDLRHHRLPDVLTLASYPIAVALLGLAAIVDSAGEGAIRALAATVVLAVFYYVLALLRPGGIGLGDVKLAGVLGLYMGWVGWAEIITATVVSFLGAAVVAVALMAGGRATRSSRMAFGPFMIAGALVSITLAS